MPEEPETTIRKFKVQDREVVRQIAYDTAFMGDPAGIFFQGKKIFCDALSLYFTDYEPQSCFVAEAGAEVIGYLMGAKDKAAADKLINKKILPGLLAEGLFGGVFFRKKNFSFLLSLLLSLLRGQFQEPDFRKNYPATLHINLRQDFRGRHIGARLMAAYFNYLKEENVEGIHLATMSDAAGIFFAQEGFILLYSGKRSYFRHILHKDAPLYIYGKRL